MRKLKKMLEEHEGKRDYAYTDVNGKWHIGIGRNIDADGGLGLSDDEIDMLLDNDIVRTIKELTGEFPWFPKLDEVRADALIQIAFNLGLTRLRKFKRALMAMQNAIEKADDSFFGIAKIEFLDSIWSTQVGQRAVTLSTMIETGQYPDGYD